MSEEKEKSTTSVEKKDFSATLNLPQTDFQMRGDLPKKEPGILEGIFENGLYEKILKKNEGHKHYVLHDSNGYIAIYTIDGNGKENLKENTGISTKYLPNEDITLLEKGVKANGDNELAEKLSDFE